MEQLIQLGIVGFLLLLGLSAGRIAERRHLASLDKREREFEGVVVVTDLRAFPGGVEPGTSAVLVSGEAAISSDYFKTFVANLKKIVGGELRSLESLMTRARREAVTRMVLQARALGYDSVCNVRLEGFDITGTSQKKKAVTLVAVLASGTAYRRAGGPGGPSGADLQPRPLP